MANTTPALKNKLLLSAEQSVSCEGSYSILSLLNFCVVLPGTNSNSQIVMIYLSLEKSVETALLLSFLVFKLFDRRVLGFNLLRYLSNFVVFARCVLVKVCLVLYHIAVAHVFVLFDKLILKVLIKSIKNSRECLNSSRCVTNRNGRWNFCYFAEFSHFWPSRKITHLCWLYYEHITLAGLTLSEFPEITLNVLTHNIMVLTDSTCRRWGIIRFLGLLADWLLIRSLLLQLVMVVSR